MGIVNITPDSFSGDGLLAAGSLPDALARGPDTEGADIVDVGGESTRPGFVPVAAEEEIRRIVPVIRSFATVSDLPISVDTTKPDVARAALAAGARVVNDVSGLASPDVARAAGEAHAGYVAVHHGPGMGIGDLVTDICRELENIVNRAEGCGVAGANIVVDPGLGFGKTWKHNFEIMRGLEQLRSLGRPVLIGASRKGMIGRILSVAPADRLEGSLALAVMAVAKGADMVRVHDVRATFRAVRVADQLARPR